MLGRIPTLAKQIQIKCDQPVIVPAHLGPHCPFTRESFDQGHFSIFIFHYFELDELLEIVSCTIFCQFSKEERFDHFLSVENEHTEHDLRHRFPSYISHSLPLNCCFINRLPKNVPLEPKT
jgi:hypothetical protein